MSPVSPAIRSHLHCLQFLMEYRTFYVTMVLVLWLCVPFFPQASRGTSPSQSLIFRIAHTPKGLSLQHYEKSYSMMRQDNRALRRGMKHLRTK